MKIISILGPTASGKTKLAICLAKKYNGEIVNSDSRIVYKDFSIGTDKPKKDAYSKNYKVDGINHYLIDFLSPTKTYSIARFNKLLKEKIDLIISKNKLPILVGGSSLYMDSFLYDYQIANKKVNWGLRKKLNKESIENLLDRLKQLSSKSFSIVDKKNKRRIIRALELAESGLNIERQEKILKTGILLLGIKKEKDNIYKLIDKRVDSMIKNGLVKEVKRLLRKYPRKSPAFSSIGYSRVIDYIKGKSSLDDAVTKIKIDTHHLAKKQLTWLKKDPNIIWLDKKHVADKLVKDFLKN